MREAAEVPGLYARSRRRAAALATGSVSAEEPAFAPPVALSAGPLGVVQAADREIARQTALQARAVAEFAASRPASADRAQGERGAMSPERWAARPGVLREVSEWAAPELSVALSRTQRAADGLLERSLLLVHRLPGTLAALEAGALHPGHLYPLLEHVAPIADDAVRAEVEAVVLRWAAGRVTTSAQLGDKVRREVLRRDVRAAARRLSRAISERGVSLRPEPTDGMAALLVSATVPEAHALHAALGAYADALPADGRTRGQKMLDCLLELVLRPGESDLPPVQVLLTVVASVGTLAGGDVPAEIDGRPVPAELARALLRALGAQPAQPEEEPEAEPPPGAWQEGEQEDLERWWDEMTRRVLAGDHDDEPVWASDAESAQHDRQRFLPDDDINVDTNCPPRAVTPETRVAGVTEREPAAASLDRAGPPGSTGDRWWQRADRAVGDAGAALREAIEAIGRAQRLVDTARRADAADETAWRSSPAGRITAAPDALAQLAAATDQQRAALADLLADTGGGGLAERPRIALTDAATGALLALTDLPELRRNAHCGRPACRRRPQTCVHDLTGRPDLGPPGPTDGYRPAAALDRFVRARDRRCRFPGCRRRVPRGGELDHDVRYPDGPTAATNLAGYCTADHRGKHQAPGWRHQLAPDGTLTVTTPTGLVAVTTPPPY